MGKRLGQHFLRNKKIIELIVDSLELKKQETVIEIGAGHGELTFTLIKKCEDLNCQIIAVEKDSVLAKELELRIKNLEIGNVQIINGDARKVLPQFPQSYMLNTNSYKVVGNIPYYLTGKLLRILGDLDLKPKIIVLTIQKEVAERIVAKPPKMNLLAAAVGFWAKSKILKIVSRKDFNPAPEVMSAVIKIVPQKETSNKEKFYRLLKIMFKQPRKTILNNLASGLNLPKEKISKILTEQKINPSWRPQNLSIEKIKKLAKSLPAP